LVKNFKVQNVFFSSSPFRMLSYEFLEKGDGKYMKLYLALCLGQTRKK
jgi:hypothetical protein